jgi:ribosomal protein S18 acetylase RimI-like enzyme
LRVDDSFRENLELRPASDADKPALFTLHCETMRQAIEATWEWNEAWQREDFDRRFAACLVSVIEIQGHMAGAIWIEPDPQRIYIAELQVRPEWQGRGIGTAVLERTIAEGAAHGVPVELSVLEANPRARQLYERLGFEVIEKAPPFVHLRHGTGQSSGGSDVA